MKAIVCLLVIGAGYHVFAASVEEPPVIALKKAIREQLQTCGKELKVDVSPFMGDTMPDMSKLSEEDYICLTKCLLQKFGVVDTAGKYKREEMKALFPELPADLDEAIIECINKHEAETDQCVKFTKAHKCLIEKITAK